MDGEWTLPVEPTACPPRTTALSDRFIELFPEFKRLPDDEFVVEQVRSLSVSLKTNRWYYPSTWAARAYNLLRLGFPELAVGDAYKATMLMASYRNGETPVALALKRLVTYSLTMEISGTPISSERARNIKDYANYTSDRVALVFAQALFIANCFVECYEHLRTYQTKHNSGRDRFEDLKELAERAIILEGIARAQSGDNASNAAHDAQEARRSGRITPQIYPWMLPFLKRESETLGFISKDLDFDSWGKCLLAESELSDEITRDDEAEQEAQVFGITATRSCSEGEILLDEETFMSGMDDRTGRCHCCGALLDSAQPVEIGCCNARFCDEHCRKSSLSVHRIICPSSRSLMAIPSHILMQDTVSPATLAYNELLHRLFAYAGDDLSVHPLKLPIINAMAPALRDKGPISFSFANDIKRPLTMLIFLGICPFKYQCLDTWVIQNINARVRNNARAFTDDTDCCHIAINPCYMFFNHSCRPNVCAHHRESGGSQMLVYAKRDISENEELFVSYIDEAKLNVPYAERQVLLKSWLGGECRCARCKDELESMKRVDEEVKFLLAPLNVGLEDYSADNSIDTDTDDDMSGPSNRYATDDTLNEDHPTMISLRRSRPSYERRHKPIDYENDGYRGESPLRGKGKSLRD